MKYDLFIEYDITVSSQEMKLPAHLLSVNNSAQFVCPVVRQKTIDHECVMSLCRLMMRMRKQS